MDCDALCDKLEEGSLGAAILDVFAPKPIDAGPRLSGTTNLIFTPHVSADDRDAYVPVTLGLFFRNMRLFLNDKPLLNPIDPKLGDGPHPLTCRDQRPAPTIPQDRVLERSRRITSLGQTAGLLPAPPHRLRRAG